MRLNLLYLLFFVLRFTTHAANSNATAPNSTKPLTSTSTAHFTKPITSTKKSNTTKTSTTTTKPTTSAQTTKTSSPSSTSTTSVSNHSKTTARSFVATTAPTSNTSVNPVKPTCSEWRALKKLPSSTTAIPLKELSIDLIGIFSSIYMPYMMAKTQKCYETGKDGLIVQNICEGICVSKTEIFANFSRVRTFHCQRYNTYSPKSFKVCSDLENDYPNVRVYKNNQTLSVVHLFCCTENLCNGQHSHVPILPTPYKAQEEDDGSDNFDVTMVVAVMIIIAWLVVEPFIMFVRERRQTKQMCISLNEHVERAVILLEYKPRIDLVNIKQRFSGKLKLDELIEVFTYMDMHDPNTRIRVHDVNPSVITRYKEYYIRSRGIRGLIRSTRTSRVKYEVELWTVIEHGPYQFDWRPIDLVELFDQAKEEFEKDNILLHISAPLVVIGDIRGQYADLFRWLQIIGFPPRKKLLFLGGVVDPQEPGSLECLALIAAMKVAFPRRVFLLLGAAEAIRMKFPQRFSPINDQTVQSAATRMCSYLPLAARISKKVLAVHSGISHQMSDPSCFKRIERPMNFDQLPLLVREIVNSQPTTVIKMYREDHVSGAHFFGFDAVRRLCKTMGIRYVVRSRNPLPRGYLLNDNGALVSIYSAPGRDYDEGSVMYIDDKINVKFFTMQASHVENPE